MERSYLFPAISFGGDKKCLGGAVVSFFGLRFFQRSSTSGRSLASIILALVIQRETVGLHVIEKYLVGAAALGEDQDGGGDTGVGLEHAGGQRDHAFELVFFHQQLADGLVGLAGAEQHAVGHDHGAAAAVPEHAQHQGEEQQFGLLGLDLAQQGGVDVLIVQAALEGRVGEDDVEGVGGLVRELVGEAVAQGVLVVDVRGVDAVQQQVHGGDAQHGGVEVEAMEHAGADVLPVVFQQVAGVDGLGVAVDLLLVGPLRRGVGAQQVFHDADQEAAGAAGRIGDGLGRLAGRASPPSGG